MNKLADQYNNNYHHSFNKKTINADYSALAKKIKTNPKVIKFKVNDRFKTTKYKNIFSKGYTENWSREIFIINSVTKTNPWTYQLKDLHGEKNNFYEEVVMKRNCCWVYYKGVIIQNQKIILEIKSK